MAAALVPDRNGGSKQMNPFCACPAAWTNHSLHREINTPTLVLLRLGHVGPSYGNVPVRKLIPVSAFPTSASGLGVFNLR